MYTEILTCTGRTKPKESEKTRKNTVQISQPVDTTEPNLKEAHETECTVKSQPLHSHTLSREA